jgi:hypothetical protein
VWPGGLIQRFIQCAVSCLLRTLSASVPRAAKRCLRRPVLAVWFGARSCQAAATDSGGRAWTILTVLRLTVMTWAMRRTMYWGSSGRLAKAVSDTRFLIEDEDWKGAVSEKWT